MVDVFITAPFGFFRKRVKEKKGEDGSYKQNGVKRNREFWEGVIFQRIGCVGDVVFFKST